MHLAAIEGDVETIKMLIENEEDLNLDSQNPDVIFKNIF